jgi:hypothetical protein
MVYPNGTTNLLNIGLASSPFLDSNGDGKPNASDPAPILVSSQVVIKNLGVVNGSNELAWTSIPGATNFLLSTTNLVKWTVAPVLTNSTVSPPPAGWPITNVIFVPTNGFSGSYRVKIMQNNSILYGQ